ncbi:UNVERIFIED_CONTAM: hypothetical protein PYX00_009387 [Menopon gallinae]|uniref:ELMO domain-containing protein n=1 Tax=Menopon gallinae TaxID=328185 RepID=A0AAW2HAV3_9NEOP
MESNWIKVALEVNRTTQLTTLNMKLELDEIIKGICEENGIRYEPGAYALKVQDFSKTAGTEYATEENKKELKHGCQLKLSRSPSERALALIDKLHKSKDTESSLKSLKELAAASKDKVMLQEMHKHNTLQHLRVFASVRELSDGEYYRFYRVIGRFLANDYIQQPCEDEVAHLMDLVTCDKKTTVEMLLLSFELLILLRKKGKLYWPMKNLRKLTPYVRLYGEIMVQERTIQLINYLYLYSIDPEERKTVQEFMQSSLMITYINKYVIRQRLTDSMKQQLYMYQKIILRKYNQQLTPIDLKEDKILEKLEYVVMNISLVNQVKDMKSSSEVRMSEERQDVDKAYQIFKSMKTFLSPGGRQRTLSVPNLEGRTLSERFRSEDEDSENRFLLEKIEQRLPLHREVSVESVGEDLNKDDLEGGSAVSGRPESYEAVAAAEATPALVRDNLYYFIVNDFKGFERFLYIQKSQLKSILRVGISVTNLLCRIFEIHHKEPELKKGRFVPLCFLYYERFLERMFCIAFKLFHQSRQEMNVSIDSPEYPVVLRTVEDQLKLALEVEPIDFVDLEKTLAELTVEVVNQKRMEMIKKDLERQLTQEPAFIELKEMITPRIMDTIRKKRLKFMEDGEHVPQFDYKGQRVVGKRWFLYISKRHDTVLIEECPNNPCKGQHKPLETVQVSDIVEVEFGSKSNFHKEVYYNLCSERDMFFRPGAKPDLRFPISLRMQNHYYVDFCAGSTMTMDYWVDGLNCLTGGKMTSETVTQEYNHLMDIELMTHLAGLEEANFPDKPPPVPSPPSDYNFCTP